MNTLDSYAYRGRHRAPSTTGQTAARVAAAGVAAAVPIALAPAASAGPAGGWGPVIACESGGNPTATNRTSTASGLLQFINGTWRAYGGGQFAPRAKDATPAEQMIVAERAYAAEGLRPWAASKSCWSPKIQASGRHAAVVPAAAKAPTATPARQAARFAWPMQGRLSQHQHTGHKGIDIAAPIGAPQVAAAAGTVISAGPASGYGLWVRLRLADGTVLVYGHMSTIKVRVGQQVAAGQVIALCGAGGNSTGPHLHFEVHTRSGRVGDAAGWLASRGVRAGQAAVAAPRPRAVTAGRARDGSGSYVCDRGRLYFEACDPATLGQVVPYPLYRRR